MLRHCCVEKFFFYWDLYKFYSLSNICDCRREKKSKLSTDDDDDDELKGRARPSSRGLSFTN